MYQLLSSFKHLKLTSCSVPPLQLVVDLEEQMINAECEVAYQQNELEAARMEQAREW